MAQTIRFFWKSLSQLVGAGFALVPALEIISRNLSPNNNFAPVLKAIIKDVKSGLSLSEAMVNNPRFFSRMEMNVVSTGEISNMLEVV